MLHFLLLVTGTLLAVSALTGMLHGYAIGRDLLEVRASIRRGAIAGAAVAAVLALLEFTTGFVVREYYNLALLCVAVVSELALASMLAATRSLAPEKAAALPLRLAFFIVLFSWGAFYLPDIFIYPSQFAVGVVQVASSEFVFIVTGYITGILLCLLAGYSVFRICRGLPEKILFPIFSLALAAFCLGQLVSTGQILLGRGLVPRYNLALDVIIFLLDNAPLLLYWIIGTGVLAAVILWLRSGKAEIAGENPALRRKARSALRTHMRWSKTAILSLSAGLLVMTAGARFSAREVELSPPLEMTATDGEIAHPTAVVGDGALHRFVYKTQKGVNVRYIIIKKSETAYGVGLDACDVCGPSGYFERKGQVVCILCDVVMNKSTIGFAGGCNPVPIKFSLKDGGVIINARDLEAQAHRFM
ncbi:MAG: Fe-S-containing protein [Desulfovibrio sp.]|jgi:uncharacterized membrane protein|nr:Fe-S-containing protein [Desulfovibrio sp.]